MIFAGLIPYLFIAEVMTRASTTIVGVPNLVKKIRFPLGLLPIVVVATALCLSAINSALLVLAIIFLRGSAPTTILYLPLIYFPLCLLLLGAAWLLSMIGVFIRDTAQFVPVVVQLLMFLAPVCYPLEAAPPTFASAIAFNPLTYFVNEFRNVALLGHGLNWLQWGEITLWCAIGAVLGAVLFERARPTFADLL
jgi:lipopolysaccharide transport system permease protein